jgi:uncharacterized protein (DUF2236 family)
VSVERAIEPVRIEIQHLVRSFVTGSPQPPRRLFDPSDPSLFEPDSVIWRVHADVSMFIGGLRALLMQTLHEPTMTGVADHSDYRNDPLGRLRRTANFLGVTTYGPRTKALETIQAVRRIHDRVQGTLADGTPYSANDPHLLGWVHATEVDSFLRAYQRYATRRLDAAQADRYVDEMAVVARLIGVEHPPVDRAELRATLHRYRPELRITPKTRDAVRFLLHPPFPLLARPTYNVIAGAAVSLLPGYARRMLWLPVPPGVEPLMVRPVATALMRTLGWALAPAPAE